MAFEANAASKITFFDIAEPKNIALAQQVRDDSRASFHTIYSEQALSRLRSSDRNSLDIPIFIIT